MYKDKKYPYIGLHRSGLTVKFFEKGYGEVLANGLINYPFTDQYEINSVQDGWNEKAFNQIQILEGENEMQNLRKGDLIIGSQLKSGGAVSFAKEPKVQTNFIVASGEAERLAKLDPTKKFVVVEVKGVCSVQSTIWE